MLYQDPLDFPALTVLDNFVLGCSGGIAGSTCARARRGLKTLAAQFDFTLDPDAAVSALSVGERQQLEIARLLWLGVRALCSTNRPPRSPHSKRPSCSGRSVS